MASVNVIDWIEKNSRYVGKDVLEIGSKKHNDHEFLGLRDYLGKKKPDVSLLGCDISTGENVDVVVDLAGSPKSIKKALGNRQFDTLFCVSVLEHIPNVFAASNNMMNLLKTGGSLFVSVPFVFRYHGYPGDLWRFTPEGIQYLFPDVDFADYRHSTVSTLEEGDVMKLSGKRVEKLNRFIFRPKGVEDKLLRKKLKREGKKVDPYSLAPCMINMLGFKK